LSAPNARLGAQSTTLLDTTLLDTTLLDGVAELSRIWIKAAPHAAPRPGVSAGLQPWEAPAVARRATAEADHINLTVSSAARTAPH